MAGYLLGIFGIVVSVVLFLIGYRQTVGAKKERVAAANAQLERTLIRRVVLEKHTPLQVDLSRLIEGKARDHRVQPSDLLSEGQLLNTIYTRVTESDLIPAEQREEILQRIAPAFSAFEAAPLKEKILEEAAASKRDRQSTEWITAMLALLATVVGGLISVLPTIKTLQGRIDIKTLQARAEELLPMLATTMAVSLAFIGFAYVFFRLRSSQEESPSKRTEVSSYLTFEAAVRDLLKDAGFVIRATGPGDRGFDFVAERGGRTVLVEVKDWPRSVPPQFVSHVVERLRSAAKSGGGEALLVTRRPVRRLPEDASTQDVKVVTLEELRSFVRKQTG